MLQQKPPAPSANPFDTSAQERQPPTPSQAAEAQRELDATNADRRQRGLPRIPTKQDMSQPSQHDRELGTVNTGNTAAPAPAPASPTGALTPAAGAAHEVGHATADRAGVNADDRFDNSTAAGATAGKSAEEAQASARGARDGKTLTPAERQTLQEESAQHLDNARGASAMMQGDTGLSADHPAKMFVDVSQEDDPENLERKNKPRPAAGSKIDRNGNVTPAPQKNYPNDHGLGLLNMAWTAFKGWLDR